MQNLQLHVHVCCKFCIYTHPVNSKFTTWHMIKTLSRPIISSICISATQLECFVPRLIEIGPVVLEKKMKIWELLRRTDKQKDGQIDKQSEKLTIVQLRWSSWCLEVALRQSVVFICRKCVCKNQWNGVPDF